MPLKKLLTPLVMLPLAGSVQPAIPAESPACALQVLGSNACDTACDHRVDTDVRFRTAVERLAEYLDASALQEPHALLILNVINRWYGGDRYADALARYDAAIPLDPPKAPVLRVYRRILAADSPLDPHDYREVYKDVDVVTAPAMLCDRLELPDGYAAKLVAALDQGGYLLTHAALAWMWALENGCPLDLPGDFEPVLVDSVAGLIGQSDAVTDLEIEAAALLHAMGHGSRVDPEFIERVVAAQLPSGGYREDSASSEDASWHTSVLAFWLLLQHACPSASPPPMLALPDASRKSGSKQRARD